MKAIPTMIALIVLTGLGWSQPSQGQQGAPSGPARMYDASTVTTVHGQVVSVDTAAGRRAGSMGIHLLLKTATEQIPVHLGPARFIDRQELKIAAGDVIDVTGSRITYQGKPAIIAASISKGQQTLTLRDSAGFPLWGRGAGR